MRSVRNNVWHTVQNAYEKLMAIMCSFVRTLLDWSSLISYSTHIHNHYVFAFTWAQINHPHKIIAHKHEIRTPCYSMTQQNFTRHTQKHQTHTHSFWFHLVSTFVRWNKKTHSTENNSRHTLERRMIYIKPKVNALRINWSMQKTFWNEFSWQLTHLKCAFQTVNALYFLHSQIVCIICCWSFAQNNAVKSIGMKQKKNTSKENSTLCQFTYTQCPNQ